MEDRRVAKTKKAIKKVFLELLKDKNLNKISVAELSREADLGRGTFYLHYTDVYDLYNQIEDELYSDLVRIFDETYPDCNADLMQLTETITKYIVENKDIFLLLISSDADGKPMRKLKEIFCNKLLQKEYVPTVSKFEEIESLYIVSGVIGVLEGWISTGLEMPQKEIAGILCKILSYSII